MGIFPENRKIIPPCKTFIIVDEEAAWIKMQSKNSFDITMGSFDGAETCELVDSYLLSQLPKNIREKVGLYRDDGLGAFKESSRRIEQIKKQI